MMTWRSWSKENSLDVNIPAKNPVINEVLDKAYNLSNDNPKEFLSNELFW